MYVMNVVHRKNNRWMYVRMGLYIANYMQEFGIIRQTRITNKTNIFNQDTVYCNKKYLIKYATCVDHRQ